MTKKKMTNERAGNGAKTTTGANAKEEADSLRE
jgi:hypothetical protein